MTWLLWSQLSCDLGYLERQEAIALDYRIDRPRILAVDLDPPHVWPGTPTEITALGLAPGQEVLDRVQVDLCTLGDAFPTLLTNLECHNVPEYVQVLGTTPLTWTPPHRDGFDCDRMAHDWRSDAHRDCASEVPLLLSATTRGGERALATLDIILPFDDALPYLDPPSQARFEGLTLSVDGSPTAGGTLELTAQVTFDSPSRVNFPDATWFVDAGELEHTGRTRWEEVGPPGSDALPTADSGVALPVDHTTHNRLRIPGDWHGPLRIVLVIVDGYDAPWVIQAVDVP